MLRKILVFANCQAGPLGSLLGQLSSDLQIVRCPAVHTLSASDESILTDLVTNSDIIVHQPIGERFGPLSSAKLIERFPRKTYISFPTIYFGGLFPQLLYLRKPAGGTLRGPLGDYHDSRIIDCFISGENTQVCYEKVLSDSNDYIDDFENSISVLEERDSVVDITVADFIKNAAQERPCFYTFNHPDNGILLEVAKAILTRLGLSFDANATVRQKPYLGGVSAAVPTRLAEHLGVSWRRDNYGTDAQVMEWQPLIEDFFQCYRTTDNFASIVHFNKTRKVL